MAMNFTEIIGNFTSWSLQGYTDSTYAVVGVFFWPMMFMAVFGYVYIKQQSAVAAVVASIIIFAAFGATGVFAGAEIFTQMMHLFTALILTALFLVILSKRRQN